MTAPDATPEPGNGAPDAGDGSRRRRIALTGVVVAVAAVLIGGLAVIAQGSDQPGPLDDAAPGLAEFTLTPGDECVYDADRGGLVAHFEVRTGAAGRFTLDVEATTTEGVDNADITSPHVVRVSVPFHGGRTHKEFDVVVPLSEADYRDGYSECRWHVNGRE